MDQHNLDARCEEIDSALKLEPTGNTLRAIGSGDREEILEWLAHHRVKVTELPKVGFRTDTIACFINQMECGIAMLDQLVKKPGSKDNELEGALVVKSCVDWAKDSGFSLLIAVSTHSNVIKYSEAFGFNLEPHCYLTKEI